MVFRPLLFAVLAATGCSALGPAPAAFAQTEVSSDDISAAFDESPAVSEDFSNEVEEIVETKPEPVFRFTLPYNRDPFLPAIPKDNGPSAPASPFVSTAYQLKGTWRQLGGEWQAILQDVSGEPVVVAVGDIVGGAEVMSITAAEVTLRWADVAIKGGAEFRRLTLSL